MSSGVRPFSIMDNADITSRAREGMSVLSVVESVQVGGRQQRRTAPRRPSTSGPCHAHARIFPRGRETNLGAARVRCTCIYGQG